LNKNQNSIPELGKITFFHIVFLYDIEYIK